MEKRKSPSVLLLLVLSIMILGAGSAVAEDTDVVDFTLIIDGEAVETDMYIQDGRTYVSAEYLAGMLEIDLDDDYVALREVMEETGATVNWNSAERAVEVTTDGYVPDLDYQGEETQGLSGDEIAYRAEEYLFDQNTYRMSGDGVISVEMDSPDMSEEEREQLAGMEIPVTLEAGVSYQPFVVHVIQHIDIADQLGLGQDLDPEMEADLAGMGMDMVQEEEMLMTEEAMYQRISEDQWIVTEFDEVGMNDMMQFMLNLDPAASMEMAEEFGISYELKGEEVIEGEDYYLLYVHLDENVFTEVMQDMFGGFEGMMQMPELADVDEEEYQEMMAELEELFDNIEINMEQYMYVKQDNFETTRITLDMDYGFSIVEEDQEMSMNSTMSMDMDVYDYGVDIEFPEVENAMTQEEYMEQLMEQMEQMEQFEEFEDMEDFEEMEEVEGL